MLCVLYAKFVFWLTSTAHLRL